MGLGGEGRVYIDPEEAISAYELGYLDLHARILVKLPALGGAVLLAVKNIC